MTGVKPTHVHESMIQHKTVFRKTINLCTRGKYLGKY